MIVQEVAVEPKAVIAASGALHDADALKREVSKVERQKACRRGQPIAARRHQIEAALQDQRIAADFPLSIGVLRLKARVDDLVSVRARVAKAGVVRLVEDRDARCDSRESLKPNPA